MLICKRGSTAFIAFVYLLFSINLSIAQELQDDTQTGQETQDSSETTNEFEIRKCIKQSAEKNIETYDKIIKNFTKVTNVRALNPRLHTVMAAEFFKPCPVYIAEVPKFQNYFKIDKKFVFQKSLREMAFRSFKPEVIYRQALESSSWESEIAEHFPTSNQIGNDSKEQLNDIVGNLYKEFQNEFTDIYRKKTQGVSDLPSKIVKSSSINIETCDEAKNNCLNLVGILQLQFGWKNTKASMKIIGAVFKVSYAESMYPVESSRLALLTKISEKLNIKDLEYIWSYHKNFHDIRKLLKEQYFMQYSSPTVLKKPAVANLDSLDYKSCEIALPEPMKTRSDCIASMKREEELQKQREESLEQYARSRFTMGVFREEIHNQQYLPVEYRTNANFQRIARKTKKGKSCQRWDSQLWQNNKYYKKLNGKQYFPFFWYSTDQVFVNEGCLDCCTDVEGKGKWWCFVDRNGGWQDCDAPIEVPRGKGRNRNGQQTSDENSNAPRGKGRNMNDQQQSQRKRRSYNPDESVVKFKDSFYFQVNKTVSTIASLMTPRDFERSACMLDKFDQDKNKKTAYRIVNNVDFAKLENAFARFLRDMFGQGETCTVCVTGLLRKHYSDFKRHIESLKSDIKEKVAKKATRHQANPYLHDFAMGEFAHMQYYIVYEIVDWKVESDSNEPSESVDSSVDQFLCTMVPSTPGCEEQNNNLIPQNIHMAIYAFYSEIKLKQTSMESNKIVPLEHRLKEEYMKQFFQYQFITDVIKSMAPEFHSRYPRIQVNGEQHILNVINDIDYPTRNGICTKVVKLFENCYTRNNQKRHFIFMIDGAGSFSKSFYEYSKDLESMKNSIMSMVNYPLNGQNKVSVVDFSSSISLCEGQLEPDGIESCIDRSFEAILAEHNINNRVKELSITMTWACQTDLDVWITEPSGERIGFSHMKSRTGGELDLDQTAPQPSAQGYAENIAWSNAPTGSYKLQVHTYRACTDGAGCCTGSPYALVVNRRGRRKTFRGVVGQHQQWDDITTFYHDSNMNAASATEAYSTSLSESLDYVRNNALEAGYKNVAVIFNGGIPNQQVENKVAELKRHQNVADVTGFGIGEQFGYSNNQRKLNFLTRSAPDKEHFVESYEEFEENRLDLQNTICSVDYN